jgi:hypothetical protein
MKYKATIGIQIEIEGIEFDCDEGPQDEEELKEVAVNTWYETWGKNAGPISIHNGEIYSWERIS